MRHRSRHVHQTMADVIKAALTAGDWFSSTPPYGATAATFVTIEPQQAGLPIKPNTVAVTLEAKVPAEEQEVGASTGGLWKVSWVLFTDVYAENWSTAMALCDDVDAALAGAIVPLNDYTTGTGVPTDDWVEVQGVSVAEPPAAGAMEHQWWRVVHAPINVYYQGEA